MAANLRQKASNTSLLATVAATFGVAPQAGNLLVAAVTANVGSLAISGWTNAATIAVGIAGELDIFYKVSAGTETTVTATGTLAAFMDLHIFEYSGIDNASPLDKTATTADGGAGVTSRASGTTATLTQANELAFAAVATAGTNGGNVSWSNSYVAETTTTDLQTADLITTVTTATSSTATWNTSQRAAGAIVTFFGETGDSYALKWPLKPRVASINWGNPITKGLLFNVPLTERGSVKPKDLISQYSATGFSNAVTWKTDIFGANIQFTGGNASVPFAPPVLSSNVFSLLALINPTGVVGNQTMTGPAQIGGVQLRLTAAKLNLIKSNQVDVATSTGSISANVWSLVGVTYDASGNFIFYNNGVNIGSGTNAQTFNPYNPTIGKNEFSGDDYFTGKIGLISIWKRVLNAQEMKQLNQNPWQLYNAPGLLRDP